MIRKKKINKNVVYILSVLLLLFIGYGVYEFYNGQIDKKNVSEEVSEKLLSDKKYGNVTIENISINELKGNLSFNAQVKNESTQFHALELVKLIFLDKNGKIVCTSTTTFPNMEVEKTSNIHINLEKKCKNSYTFVIEKIEEEGNKEDER